MEDIAGYSDDQIGAAVRELHDQCRDSIARYVTLQPVIDGVEGTFAKAPSSDPNLVKFVGNVPAKPPAGGTLRHKGWRAAKVDLPALVGQAGRRHHRPRGNRNRVRKPRLPNTSSASTWAPPTPRWPTPRSSRMPTRSRPPNVQLLAIPQLVNPGEVRDEDLLPSFLYLPGASDFPAGTIGPALGCRAASS